MGTGLIKNRKNGARLDRLTDQQQQFVLALLASDTYSPSHAAKQAGYSNPSQAANKLLKKRAIKAILGKAKREREERTQITGDEVWQYLHRVLNYNPLRLFVPDKDGWMVQDLEDIPEEVGQLIEEMEVQIYEDGEGERHTRVKVRLVSKAAALAIAAKHAIPQQHDVRHTLDWDAMVSEPNEREGIVEPLLLEHKPTGGS